MEYTFELTCIEKLGLGNARPLRNTPGHLRIQNCQSFHHSFPFSVAVNPLSSPMFDMVLTEKR